MCLYPLCNFNLVAVDTSLSRQKQLMARQISEKLQVLDDREQSLLDLLAEPLLPSSRSHRDATDLGSEEEKKGVSMVSIPSRGSQGQGQDQGQGHGACDRGRGEFRLSAASTTDVGVSAPAVLNTFEVATTWGDDLHEELLLLTHKTDDKDDKDDDPDTAFTVDIDKYDSGLGMGGLRLLQCAPGVRDGVLQYRKELKR